MSGSPSTGLVFARIVDGGTDLARARLSDGAVAALTHTPDRDETWPYWSELARRMVFQVGPLNERSPGDLFLWRPNTGEETRITETPQRNEGWAVWSPTRREFAFAFLGPESSGVALYDLETGGARLIVNSARERVFLRPTFSPDGARFVVQLRGADGRGSNLWLLQEGTQPLPLTSSPEWFDIKAWFSRDGRRIVFSRRPSGGGGWFDVLDVGAQGGEARTIVHSEEADNHSARPSPIRDEIAFVSDRDGNFEVYLAGIDGSGPRRLTETERDEFAPRWSPDGELLAVTVAESEAGLPRLSDLESLEGARIVVLNRNGDELFEVAGFMPDWMPPW